MEEMQLEEDEMAPGEELLLDEEEAEPAEVSKSQGKQENGESEFKTLGSVSETYPFLQFNAGGTSITGFTKSPIAPLDIVIPAGHYKDGSTFYEDDGPGRSYVAITTIGNDAFSGAALTGVTFETGSAITSLGVRAFQSNNFTTITLPNTVSSLGSYVFSGCSNLQSIDLSNLTSLVTLPTYAFHNCTSLTTAVLPNGLKTIENYAFYICSLITYIKIPASVTAINGGYVFWNWGANSIIDLTDHEPGSIAGAPWFARHAIIRWKDTGNDNTSDYVFNKTTGKICGLKESVVVADGQYNAVIPASIDGITVTGLADGAFGSRPANRKLRTVVFDNALAITNIPNFAFTSTQSLRSIDFPEGITNIGDHAFRYDTNLTTIVLPASLKTVCNAAFYQATKLESVTFLGNAVTSIADNTFDTVGKTLRNIYIEEMLENSVTGAPWGAIYAAVHWKNKMVMPEIATDDSGLWDFVPSANTIVTYNDVASLNSSVNVVVPSTLYFNGIPFKITGVGYNNLRVIPANTQVGELKFSSGIIEIAGFGSVKIKSLDLGDTIQNVQTGAFQNCGLTELTLPESILRIASSSFAQNSIMGELINQAMQLILTLVLLVITQELRKLLLNNI